MTQSAEQLQKRAEKLAEQESIERRQLIAEIQRMNEETAKFVQEAHKARHEGDLAAKKTNWFELSILLALVAATIAATKAFL